MGGDISWITHLGKKILLIDFSNKIDENEIISIIKESKQTILTSKNPETLLLINIDGSKGSPSIMSEFKDFTKETKQYIKKDAIIGASGLQKVLLSGVRAFSGITLKSFNSIEEAKTYLVE
jgi:hypothetical protein